MKVLLENLLRFEDGETVTRATTSRHCAAWPDKGPAEPRDRLRPARVLHAGLHRRARRVVDLAAHARRHDRRSAATRRRSTRWCPSTW